LRLDQFGARSLGEKKRHTYGQRCSSSALSVSQVTLWVRSRSNVANRRSSSACCAGVNCTWWSSRLSLAATTWVEFPDSLDDPAAFHRLVCGLQGVKPGPAPGQAIYAGLCPYRGLRVFDVENASIFFGREALVQWLLNELRPATEGQPVNRFLAIVGHLAVENHRWHGPAWSQRSSTMLPRGAAAGRSRSADPARIQ
jgi:hypothetical protein